ncbi:MAG: rod shape-determining protein MreD [Betaproteobacteria bacterium]|nr:rod shape-determining protein MreD [Betaproteobacteria bacterium]
MLSPRETLLLPANRAFIAFTLALAFLLNLLPWGRGGAMPDFLALTLVFWNIRQPRQLGFGLAFLFGLLMDIHEGALLGEHALAYSLLSWGAIALHRRVPWFDLAGRMLHVLVLMSAAQLITLLARMAVGSGWPGWGYLLSALTTTLLWPLAEMLLLAPQRRAVERDETRPL